MYPSPVDSCCSSDLSSACAPLPASLVRLRYFFGKRMTAADFSDEQRYHQAKHALHLRYAHGRGIATGLWVEPLENKPTWLRVRRGMAIDACGREVVVPFDQCIDLDAWLSEEKARRAALDPGAYPGPLVEPGDLFTLWVGLRYRECKTGAEPTPIDPCGCDRSGSDYGRVRETFELTVLDRVQQANASAPPTPTVAELVAAMLAEDGADDDRYARALDRAIRSAQIANVEADFVLLARVVVKLDAAHERVLQITEIDPETADVLLPTHLLEAWLQGLTAELPEPRSLGEAPHAITLGSVPPATAADPFTLTLTLSSDLVAATVDGRTDLFELHRLDATGWTAPASDLTASFVASSASSPPELRLSCTDSAFFVAGGAYRLVSTMPIAAPAVDAQLRELSPRGAVHRFQLSTSLTPEPIGATP